ncbi:hypothetical protein C5167_012982 [Papaver somniferum]|uniref:Leucine-rich repeat-containing N-terminal plant-type domain-containing protein n=1 Tax=Papaver somniferum TaxID=3469 RepID=A0A4Y7J3A6_PAPSO|nr:hypothetical protein C5167_012982 [Papaver somniferum]
MPPNLQIAPNLSNVPGFLTTMGSLTRLLLSNNHLSGILPFFKPFAVVDIYGNKDLINSPITHTSTSPTNNTSRNKNISVPLGVLIAVTSVVFGVTVAILLKLLERRFLLIQLSIILH